MQREVKGLISAQNAFQSMHPIKDATILYVFERGARLISIHAPYKGCNFAATFPTPFRIDDSFQSMHPIKDATSTMHLIQA